MGYAPNDCKLRPEYDGDDSYEVIEGSEGSSTKKIDLS
ncbi:hypothetical protein CRE_23500 [Caenorhabditis remanei]|uniref:Uncharacterized protein n=1 Tax=Caenorhabditis remanei TaxID=31234 RepID=E3MH17_CAERE|nr:hypothetical protein CRE_23500 [Caenorhabditis remanei]